MVIEVLYFGELVHIPMGFLVKGVLIKRRLEGFIKFVYASGKRYSDFEGQVALLSPSYDLAMKVDDEDSKSNKKFWIIFYILTIL